MVKDRMILGRNADFSMDSNVTGVNNNVLVVAGSGAGKTMSIIEPRLLAAEDMSLIVKVSKRSLVDKYKAMFEKKGYRFLDLNFVRPAESPVCFDPLDYLENDMDIRFLAESIVKANPSKENANADPYWDDSSISLLCAEISYVLGTMDKPTMADVISLNSRLTVTPNGDGITTSLDEEFEAFRKKTGNTFFHNNWGTFSVLPARTAGCILGVLNTTLSMVFSAELQKMFTCGEKLCLEDIAKQKTILFISASAVNPALNYFINIFFAQMFKVLFEYAEDQPDGRLPIPVSVLCDDFAVGARIQNFPEYISIFREKQISVTLLVQSESQIESIYDTQDSTTIINNCDTYVFMGSMDLQTARSISLRLNAPLDDVLYMPIGQEFIFRRGQRPLITQRYNVLQDPEYQRVTAEYEKQIREQKTVRVRKERTGNPLYRRAEMQKNIINVQKTEDTTEKQEPERLDKWLANFFDTEETAV